MIPAYLSRQRWYAGGGEPGADEVRRRASDLLGSLDEGDRRLLWAIVESGRSPLPARSSASGPSGETAEFLQRATSRPCSAPTGSAYYYDATLDPELACALLSVVTEGKEQLRTGPAGDRRAVQHLARLRRPDHREAVPAPARRAQPRCRGHRSRSIGAGFDHVAKPVASWRATVTDLAFVQQYLAGGAEGWALALTSLRDLYAAGPTTRPRPVATSAPRPTGLGQMTASMHLALAEAFGVDRDGFRSVGCGPLQDDLEAPAAPAGRRRPGPAHRRPAATRSAA